MKKEISYLITPDMDFYVFLNEGRENIDALYTKEKELREKYGVQKTQWGEVPVVYRQFKTLKRYYGTVWIAYHTEKKTYIITDHYKDIEEDVKKRRYKLKKVVLEEYKKHSTKIDEDDKKQT